MHPIAYSLFRSARILVAGLAMSAALTAAAPAQTSIKILVNDTPITTYDIKNRATMLKAFTRGQQGEKQAIDQLVDEALMMQEAGRRKVSVSDDEVAAEFANRASQTKMSPTQFEQAMRQSGIDPQSFKDFLRANMAWREVVRNRFRATINITDQDVTAALGDNAAPGANTASEYMLQQILFVVPEKSSNSVVAERQREANAFRSRYKGCNTAMDVVGGRPGVVIRPTVRREDSQITGAVRDSVLSLQVGGITAPQRIDEGFQMIALCEKRAIAGQTAASNETREKLSNERGLLLARRLLRDLRSDAMIDYR